MKEKLQEIIFQGWNFFPTNYSNDATYFKGYDFF